MGFNPISDIAQLATLPAVLELGELPIADLTLLANQGELTRLDVSFTPWPVAGQGETAP